MVISYISASSLDYTLLDKKSKNRSQQICRHAVLLLTRSFTGKYLQYFLNLLKVSDHMNSKIKYHHLCSARKKDTIKIYNILEIIHNGRIHNDRQFCSHRKTECKLQYVEPAESVRL